MAVISREPVEEGNLLASGGLCTPSGYQWWRTRFTRRMKDGRVIEAETWWLKDTRSWELVSPLNPR